MVAEVPPRLTAPAQPAVFAGVALSGEFACRDDGQMAGVIATNLKSQIEGGELDRMADRRAPEPTVVHRIVRRLLVFKLAGQFALCIAQSTGDIRTFRDRYQ